MGKKGYRRLLAVLGPMRARETRKTYLARSARAFDSVTPAINGAELTREWARTMDSIPGRRFAHGADLEHLQGFIFSSKEDRVRYAHKMARIAPHLHEAGPFFVIEFSAEAFQVYEESCGEGGNGESHVGGADGGAPRLRCPSLQTG